MNAEAAKAVFINVKRCSGKASCKNSEEIDAFISNKKPILNIEYKNQQYNPDAYEPNGQMTVDIPVISWTFIELEQPEISLVEIQSVSITSSESFFPFLNSVEEDIISVATAASSTDLTKFYNDTLSGKAFF